MGPAFFLLQCPGMKIGLDCRMLGPAQGGLGRYTEQLVHNLLRIDSHNEYVLFLRQANFASVTTSNPRVTKVLADIPWYSWREQREWPALLATHHLDLMHFPHWNIPLAYQGRFVVTIHDLIMYHFPRPEATTLGPLKYWVKDRIARYVTKQAAKRAQHILTTSEFTKRDLVQTLGISHEKITVTYQAPTLLPAPSPSAVTTDKPYALYVGSAYPHKNLENLVQAWREVDSQTNGQFRLVLVGAASPFYGRLEKLMATAQIPHLIRIGHQSDAELAAWYQGAAAYVFPSLYEGFGLPPLEAMHYGVPVAASDASCLPEVLGSAALYFDPTAPDDIACVLRHILTDKATAETLVAAGRHHAAQFSWQKLAQQTLAVYEQN